MPTDSNIQDVQINHNKYVSLHDEIITALYSVYGKNEVEIVDRTEREDYYKLRVMVHMGDVALSSEQSDGCDVLIGGLLVYMVFSRGQFKEFKLSRLKLDYQEMKTGFVHPHASGTNYQELRQTYRYIDAGLKEGVSAVLQRGEKMHNLSFSGMCTGSNSPLNLHMFQLNDDVHASDQGGITADDYEFFFHQLNATLAKESDLDPPRRTSSLKSTTTDRIRDAMDSKGVLGRSVNTDKDAEACIKRIGKDNIVISGGGSVNISDHEIKTMLTDAVEKGEVDFKNSIISHSISIDIENNRILAFDDEISIDSIFSRGRIKIATDVFIKGKRKYAVIEDGYQLKNNPDTYSGFIGGTMALSRVRDKIAKKIRGVLPLISSDYVKSKVLGSKMAPKDTRVISNSDRSGRSRLVVRSINGKSGTGQVGHV